LSVQGFLLPFSTLAVSPNRVFCVANEAGAELITPPSRF
jgi:hypothetical protein